jgi:DNA transformation protein and related proteins
MNLRTKIFKDLIEEQLASIPAINFRRLFSGFGIYCDQTIFGLIHGENLYFHTDDESRQRYKKCGSTFFTAPGSKKPLKNYYEVPPDFVEQKKELVTIDQVLELIRPLGCVFKFYFRFARSISRSCSGGKPVARSIVKSMVVLPSL